MFNNKGGEDGQENEQEKPIEVDEAEAEDSQADQNVS